MGAGGFIVPSMGRSHQAKGRSWLLLFVCGVVLLLPVLCKGACNFPAIFNFGDSNSDTGTLHFVFPYNIEAENPPYGRTFFRRPANRYSDGRVSIDFFASALGLPFLSPYSQSVGSNFAHGANFAAAGATVQGVNFIVPISLTVQVNQFQVFKQQVLATIQERGDQGYLPTENVFHKAIYMLEIGGNDISYGYKTKKLTPAQISQKMLPTIARGVAAAVQKLYNAGARTILVRDIAPQGCQPFWLTVFSHSSTDFDRNGCSISYNSAVRYYNNLLRRQLAALRAKLKGATIVYVNTYDIVYDFFANPSKYGFKQTTRACCGVGGGKYNYMNSLECAATGTLNGRTVKAGSCPDPASYINWDGVHWTDQANRLLTRAIIQGNYFEPAFNLASQCNLIPI
uniref:TSA: Wollemia nobilis Ref_Wollemi_Transcript_13169_1560 transcribed RNA sequence n=1 Tax=Wollemia nobilis TaxID=56998 RepID=A0A0C9S7M8_9CONI